MTTIRSLLLGALLMAASIDAASAQEGLRFLEIPTRAQRLSAWPHDAAGNVIFGSAKVDCFVKEAGRLEGCTIAEETPANHSIGQAALALAPQYRVEISDSTPKLADGRVRIEMSLRFDKPPEPIKTATTAEIRAAYPSEANGQDGKARIGCISDPDQSLKNCKILSEEPTNAGFGQAALSLVSGYRMKPAVANGQPISSGVQFTINFTTAIIENPDWLRKPSAAETAAFWPAEATKQGYKLGKALLNCQVAVDGSLEQCIVSSEEPQGVGFGNAAMALTHIMHMRPKMVNGVAQGGATVRIPISFSYPEPETPPPPPPPPTPPPQPQPVAKATPTKGTVNPDWLRKPSEGETKAFWPAEADKSGLKEGRAVLDCDVSIDGKLSDCSVKSESPAGVGFGNAALKLSTLMLMKPKTIDGRPIDGGKVNIPVSFIRPEPTGNFDTPPDWLRKPSFDQLMSVYPRAAGEKGKNGAAMLHCWVKTDGLLRTCTVVSETPENLGFGGAALALQPTFLMKPALKNNQPVEAEITIPISFKTYGSITGNGVINTTILTSPYWSKAPTTAEILAIIGKKVGDRFAEGKVVFQCNVNKKTGSLSDCVIANTSPGMVQFAGVAKSLISKFQVNLSSISNIKDEIRVNIAFSFPDMASPSWSKRYLKRPNWVKTLSPDPNQQLFPAAAANAGLKTGSAVVDCLIGKDGVVADCSTISESAPNLGFGEMAQKIAQAFQANPWSEDGLPSDGAHIQMPIKLVRSESEEAETAAPTPATKPPAAP